MKGATVLAFAALALLSVPGRAGAIPAFARRYEMSCMACHAPAPRLSAFGEVFGGNGFALGVGEEPRKTIDTGDSLLSLLDRVDLAVRLDGFVTAAASRGNANTSLDFQTPWIVKVLAGGLLARNISYYMYFLASERGDVAGLEDAYLQFSDLGGSGVNLLVGQFQVSDPLYKRELRLSYEDYQAYRVRVGAVRADLTYDRGLLATWSPWRSGTWSLMVVSGRGLDAAGATREYDGDAWKNAALRYSQVAGPVRVGAFGYVGFEKADGQEDQIVVFGPDATITWRWMQLNVQLLRRLDSNPLLVAGGASSTVDSALAELVLGPFGANERWYVDALYNLVDSDERVVSLRLGEQATPAGFLRRYQSAALGAHYLLRRNIRLTAEGGWDVEAERGRLVTGMMLAF